MLKANKRTRAPTRMIWVDTEALNEHGKTEAGRQRLWFGHALFERYASGWDDVPVESKWLRFTTAGEFWDWVDSNIDARSQTWILAHNWNYDAGILDTSNQLLGRGWECKKYINNKPPLIVLWRGQDVSLIMVDTLNYFAVPLSFLGSSIGVEKLPMPEGTANETDWDSYAKQDVEVIHQAFLLFRRFVRDNDLGVLQPTLASQAMAAFQHRFMEDTILVHVKDDALDLERGAYHGGRTEAFWRGLTRERLYKLDVNSMYPFIMASKPLGLRFKAFFPSFKPLLWKALYSTHSLVAECRIETEEPVYGVVRDHKLIFPVGRFWATLSTPEIHYASQAGHLLEVGAWAAYEQGYPFQSFVEYFYKMRHDYRDAGNEAYAFMCKILMNSLYGKFGQNGRKWEVTEKYVWTSSQAGVFQETLDSPVINIRNRLGNTEILRQDGESENSAPIIAAEICSYGRMMLWEAMKRAGLENVYYTDTDSLVTNLEGYNALSEQLDDGKIGYFKLEDTSEDSTFWAPKDYIFGTTTRIKGVRAIAIKLGDNTYQQDRFSSWDYNLSQGKDGFIDVTSMVKHLSRENTKRVVEGEGWTKPIPLEEW